MGQLNNNEQGCFKEVKNKHYIGIAVIILSPLLGSILFLFYGNIINIMISNTDGAMGALWGSCILVTAMLGIVIVLIDCCEKIVNSRNNQK
jgi:hypothetical protein